MLFGTPVFICLFLPAALAGFLLLGRWQGRAAALFFLLLASLVFYAWWKPILVLLLLASIGVNFGVGRVVAGKRRWLVAGLGFNLGLLGFFKYAGFFAGLQGIYLPLGISFFTFQQIMFLVDRYRGELPVPSFLNYACFIAFFPHLIAGPIVRPSHIIPQFSSIRPGSGWRDNLAPGLELFLLGLAKKLVLADSFSRYADPGFAAAARAIL